MSSLGVSLERYEWIRSDADSHIMIDDETNMKELEANMRKISMDGLTWGASKLVPVGYGISKLQVNLVC